MGGTYASVFRSQHAEPQRQDELLLNLISKLKKDSRVLDIGCGPGVPYTRQLAENTRVTGIDISEVQIDIARLNVPMAHFICGDIATYDLEENHYDALFSYYSIIHVPRDEHKYLLTKLFKLLKPSGQILLCLGAGDNDDESPAHWHGTEMLWSHFDADRNIQILNDVGFKIEGSEILADQIEPDVQHLFVYGQRN